MDGVTWHTNCQLSRTHWWGRARSRVGTGSSVATHCVALLLQSCIVHRLVGLHCDVVV